MGDKFRDKYKVESSRLKQWDYSSSGYYFITICTKNKEELLGQISEGKMILNNLGHTVNDEWLKSFRIRQELHCDEYIIMPNHLHAIIIVETQGLRLHQFESQTLDASLASLPKRMPKSVSSFIGGFKSAVTKITGIPMWQPRFHDHIVRNETSYLKIKQYIINNPACWEQDKYFL